MSPRHSLEPFIQESTPSIIARKLRYAIAHGAVAPGSQLGEADVARELGVSRGPLREAMQRLTQEGLLVSIRNRGLFVIEMTDAEIRDMYVLRTAVESAACKMLVRADHVAAGQDLLSKVAEMETAAVTGDRTAMSDADMAFHEHLVALSGSRSLVRIHTTLMIETRMCLTVLQDSCRSPMNGSRNIAASPRPCGAVRRGTVGPEPIERRRRRRASATDERTGIRFGRHSPNSKLTGGPLGVDAMADRVKPGRAPCARRGEDALVQHECWCVRNRCT